MEIERLPSCLLNGKFLHCQPVDGGPIVEAPIFPVTMSESGLVQTFKVAIVCPARRSCSKCEVRRVNGYGNSFCQYYKGDSLGGYQIFGPGMGDKLNAGYKNT